MVIYKEQLVLRDLHYAIIDEVDSVLIDEARTPLIISGQSGKSTRLYEACDILAKQMERGADMEDLSKLDAIMGVEQEESGDFVVNEKDKVVNLTEQGVAKVERFLDVYKRQPFLITAALPHGFIDGLFSAGLVQLFRNDSGQSDGIHFCLKGIGAACKDGGHLGTG